MKKLLTIDDVTELLGVCKSTIYKWTSTNRISYIKIGDSLRFDKTDIDNFITSNRVAKRKKTKEKVSLDFNVHELADFLTVSENLIYKLVFYKKIPHYKIGRNVKFNKEEIEQWMQQK